MKTKILTVILTVLILAAYAASGFVFAVSAAKNIQGGSLTIIAEYSNTLLQGIEIGVFLVAGAEPDGEGGLVYYPAAHFGTALAGEINPQGFFGFDAEDAGNNRRISDMLASVINTQNINAGWNRTTDNTGRIHFAQLQAGLYLLKQRITSSGEYIMQPVIVPVPYIDEIGTFHYDVTSKPKFGPVPPPTTTPDNSTTAATTTTTGSGNNTTTTTTGGGGNNSTTTTVGGGNNSTTTTGGGGGNNTTAPGGGGGGNNTTVPGGGGGSIITTGTGGNWWVNTPTTPGDSEPGFFEVPDDRIPLDGGKTAEDLGDDLYIIYDEDDIPLGYVQLEEGDDITDWEDFDDLIPLGGLFPEDEDDPPKPSPKTSDILVYLLIAVCVAAIVSGIYFGRIKKRS
ncbi:MAG: hypothetical protein FWH24_06050 [Oscillospiraceae bacterium]|nr:hypothetical protein [Oscillospiraceae bacterium]